MSKKKFKGTGVALVTPFRKDGGIDFKGLGKLIDFNLKNGVDYLVVLGTTAETPTLTTDEKNAILGFCIETADKRVPIVYGLGGNNTHEIVVNGMKNELLSDVDAILSVSPYYNKPTQAGIVKHFTVIADASPVPVIIYNVPSRTGGGGMTVDTVVKLSDHQNIIGIKEATGDIALAQQIINNTPDNFLVISGDDEVNLPLMAIGGDGIISVIANAFPKETSDVIKLVSNGDYKKAQKAHYKILDMVELMFVEGNPAGVKAALKQVGICDDYVRLPLVKATKGLHNRIETERKKAKI
jgi:4-hydroxy-tetrahydrodipicolinate synthase